MISQGKTVKKEADFSKISLWGFFNFAKKIRMFGGGFLILPKKIRMFERGVFIEGGVLMVNTPVVCSSVFYW